MLLAKEKYFYKYISPSSSIGSENISTITPNTPTVSPKSIIDNTTVSPKSLIEIGTQTIVDGKSIGKMVETINILEDVLNEENSSLIQNHVNDKIKNITD
jgi:hypothetical protein